MEDRVKKLTDFKKLALKNQKLIEETLTLAWKNQTSFELNAELYLAKIQAENQELSEEVVALTKKNNDALEIQSEFYKKAIEAKKSREAIFSIDTEEVPLTNSNRFQKVKSEEHQLSEDRRESS